MQFQAAFAASRFGPVGAPTMVHLPDGQSIPIRHAFGTEAGPACLVPDGTEDVEFLTSIVPGDLLVIRGYVFDLPGLGPSVLADGLSFGWPGQSEDEAPWTVRLLQGERQVILASEPGDYAARVPCTNSAGGWAAVGLRLREFTLVELTVGEQTVMAELAVTAEERSWGLQGREGLEPDHGMLFFFERALRPRFVMKSVSFPLSAAFLRADGVVTSIERMDPGQTWPVSSTVPVNYVLEMEQGWFEQHGVVPGTRFAIP